MSKSNPKPAEKLEETKTPSNGASEDNWVEATNRCDGWYQVNKSEKVIYGIIRDYVKMRTKFGPADVVMIEVAAGHPITATAKEDQTQKIVTLQPGQMLGFIVSNGIKHIMEWERGTRIRLTYRGMKPTPSGAMHDYKLDTWKGSKKRSLAEMATVAATMQSAEAPAEDDGGDELPF